MRRKDVLKVLMLVGTFLLVIIVAGGINGTKDSENIPSDRVVINEVCYNVPDREARWIELYNPTSTPVNITNWNLWFYYINGPVRISQLSHGKPVILKPHGYLILCGKESNFTRWWGTPPEGTQIIEQGIGPLNDSLHLDDENWGVVDSVYWGEGDQLPPLPLNHSWARYRGGYDTNNFTNDFYDEPYPTPGYENHLAKGSPLNLTATLSDSKVKLTWKRPLSDGNVTITEYKIYRGSSGNSLELMASVNGSVTEYLDDNVTKGEKYYYAVSAVNPVGESNLSEIVSIEIPKEKEPVPSIGLAGTIGSAVMAVLIASVIWVRYRRRK